MLNKYLIKPGQGSIHDRSLLVAESNATDLAPDSEANIAFYDLCCSSWNIASYAAGLFLLS
jgi:hypothetical protein